MGQPPGHPLKHLLITQFFGAFNDNAWKLVVTFLAIRALQRDWAGSEAAFQAASQFQTTLTFCVLTLPLVVFSLPAGLLADRVSKRQVIITTKLAELVLMVAATLALWLEPEGTRLPLILLGLMGAQSALFSPAKYGILPEILPHQRLSSGNALLETWTFLAIILGTASGGLLLDLSGARVWVVGIFLAALSLLGFLASFRVPRVAQARVGGRLLPTLASAWAAMRAERVLGLAVAGSVTYWSIASLLAQDVLVYSKSVLGLSDTLSGLPLAVFGLGVGAGSLLAGRLSRSHVEYGLIPLGAILMSLTTLLLGWWGPLLPGLLGCMVVLGVASGLLVVPLNSLVQWRSPADRRGAVIALGNVFVFSGVFLGSIAATLLSGWGVSPRGILVVAGLAVALACGWALRLLPDALLRLGLILATHSFYRLKVLARERVPGEGGVLLTPNHVSFVDALMLISSLDRPIRFVVDRVYFDHWLFRPFMKSLGAIPISSTSGPRVILKALRRAGEYLDQGEVVCIFPEGELTRTGGLLPFRRGLERIVRNRSAVIVPVYLDRLWGSLFSREGGRFLFKVPREIPYPVTVAFGDPLPAGTPIPALRAAVQELAATAWEQREQGSRPLHGPFVRLARRGPFRLAFADASRPRLSRLGALAGAIGLARGLRSHWGDQRAVGILLPPSVAGALVNLAASLSGRASVNLNYTAGRRGMESMVDQAALTSLVSSRQFLEKAGLEAPRDLPMCFLEDLAPSLTILSRGISLLAAGLLPVRALERFCGAPAPVRSDQVATVIFSSGSTGEPKGVPLTHFNIGSNVEGVAQVLRAEPGDRTLGILPLFHSFGYMLLWFAAGRGVGMPLHPNPLDAPAVAELIARYRVTILLATPTFLQLYARRSTPGQLGSLRLVITGAEKLSEKVALAFEEKFGLRPLEGYGCTECSPVIAVSVPGFRAPGFFQPGSRPGFVGQPLPGVAVRIIDVDSGEDLPPGNPGLLLVRGPGVMKGYLGNRGLSREVLRKGWYSTGDVALVDEDGFLRITDRLSRFSKIGGEMVPHGAIEEALNQAVDAGTQVFAVTAVPDQRKGESLAVVHTHDEAAIPALLQELSAAGLPNLFVPRRGQFVRVERLPLLGTGKLDLRELRRLAREGLGIPPQEPSRT